MGKAKTLTEQWKERARQKAAERAAQVQSVPVVFDGFPGKAHRVALIDYAVAGKMPQYLSTAMFAGAAGKDTEVYESDVTPKQQTEWCRFQAVIFCAMMDEPKFSTQETREREGRELKPDEMDYAEFVLMAPEAVKEAIQWQLNGCPDIPVQTESGETDVDSLRKFRPRRKRSASSKSSFNREGIWWDTRPTPRHI